MNAIIVYTSLAHGNTEKVARVIAEELGAELVKTPDATPEALVSHDIIGLGSGIYDGNNDQKLFDLVAKLPQSSGKKAFVFSTSGYGITKPNEKLASALKDKGFAIIGNFACKGFDTAGVNKLYGGAAKGRPNEADLQEARAFARKLVS